MSLLEWALGNLAVAASVTLVALLADRRGAMPRLRHALWTLVLLTHLVPPVVTHAVAMPRVAAGVAHVLPAAPELVESLASPPRLVLALWALVSVGVALVTAARLARLRRLVTGGPPTPAWLQAEADDLALRVGLARRVPVRVVDARLSPAVVGLARATRVLVPAALLARLPRSSLRLVLAHELVHVRRGDPWVRLLELLVAVVLPWSPLRGLARRRLRLAEELACDAAALALDPAQRTAYGHALLDTVDLVAPVRLEPTSAFSASARELRTRLLALGTRPEARRTAPIARLAVGALALAVLTAPRPVLAPWTRIDAHDPAGVFTVEFLGDRVARLSVDGAPWPRERWRQHAGRLEAWHEGGARELALDLEPRGPGFRWTARPRRTSTEDGP